jgi:hypothetical protein
MYFSIFISVILSIAGLSPAKEGATTLRDGYLTHEMLTERMTDLQRDHPDLVTITQYGTSQEGRPLWMADVSSKPEDENTRPALLIIAGADASHLMGTELAIRALELMIKNHPEALDDVDVLMIPRANPDGVEAALANPMGLASGTRRIIDADRDGFFDEDPPRDMNGDGIISQMRILETSVKDPATHLADPSDPRLTITPDPTKNDRATFRVMIEGKDTDGDGLYAEDGSGEVLLDRNFMHLWPEHSLEAGPHQVSERESKAIADLVIANPRIIAAVVYGPHDTVISLPDSKGKDSSGRIPRELHPGDVQLHKDLAAMYTTTTGQTRSSDHGNEGSLHGWLYAHRGIPTIATTGWGRPDPALEENELTDEETTDETIEETDEHLETEANEPVEPRNAEEAAWLSYSDLDRSGDGFIEWTPFEHPQLGTVHIGGFTPGFMTTPPIEVIEELAPKHADLYQTLSAARNRIVIEGPEVESIGSGIHRIRIAMVNEGDMPTLTAMGRESRTVRPIAVRIDVPIDRILEGSRIVLVRGLDGKGARRTIEWMVRADETPISVDIDDPANGTRRMMINTQEGTSR